MPVVTNNEELLVVITSQFEDPLNWHWDEKQSAMLAEFSWEKTDRIMTKLREMFNDEWDKKNIKSLPIILKNELGELSSVSKKQLLFTRPATDDQPALVALLWPWGHGSTYSLRIKALTSTYASSDIIVSTRNPLAKLLSLFK
jgi:hypothetical protein